MPSYSYRRSKMNFSPRQRCTNCRRLTASVRKWENSRKLSCKKWLGVAFCRHSAEVKYSDTSRVAAFCGEWPLREYQVCRCSKSEPTECAKKAVNRLLLLFGFRCRHPRLPRAAGSLSVKGENMHTNMDVWNTVKVRRSLSLLANDGGGNRNRWRLFAAFLTSTTVIICNV